MPRAARARGISGVYHAILRGINRHNIFLDREDRIIFLNKLASVKKRSGCKIYGYCLMDNHVHLLIAEISETIGQIMKRLGSTFVYWYNKKHDRVGHLFQGRFFSEPVDGDEYLLTALRYIHQNPVKAGISPDCASYPWSSYHDYVNPGKTDSGLTDTTLALEIIGGKESFAQFHLIMYGDNDLQDIEDMTRATDKQAAQLIEQVLAGSSTTELLKMPVTGRNIILRELKALPGVSQRQIERFVGINRNMIQRA